MSRKKEEISTLQVQEIIFQRRLREIERLGGMTRSEMLEKANDPVIYKTIITKVKSRERRPSMAP